MARARLSHTMIFAVTKTGTLDVPRRGQSPQRAVPLITGKGKNLERRRVQYRGQPFMTRDAARVAAHSTHTAALAAGVVKATAAADRRARVPQAARFAAGWMCGMRAEA